MPASYLIDGRLFHLLLVGEYSTADIRQTVMEALDDPAFPKRAMFLMDVTGSTALASRSADELRDMAAFIAARAARFGHRLGIAAGSQVHYGLMRMAQTYSESVELNVGVFESVDEALGWLAQDD